MLFIEGTVTFPFENTACVENLAKLLLKIGCPLGY